MGFQFRYHDLSRSDVRSNHPSSTSWSVPRMCFLHAKRKSIATTKSKQQQHSKDTFDEEITIQNDDSSDNNNGRDPYNSYYALEYSRSFRRHMIRDRITGQILESFLWLDQALDKYPLAEPLPVVIGTTKQTNNNNNNTQKKERQQQTPQRGTATTVPAVPPLEGNDNHDHIGAIDDDTSSSASSRSSSAVPPTEYYWVAGGGLYEWSTYPVHYCTIDPETNLAAIRAVFESNLQWFPSQVDRLLSSWPGALAYSPAILDERIRFLMAPLPDDDIMIQVNSTDVDWPRQFYRLGRGAGMSLGQVSHALQTVPYLLLRLDPSHDDEQEQDGPPLVTVATLARLYEDQASTRIVSIIHTHLDAWLTGATTAEVTAMSHLHWKGWEWTQCRIVLSAWPGAIRPAMADAWDKGTTLGVVTDHNGISGNIVGDRQGRRVRGESRRRNNPNNQINGHFSTTSIRFLLTRLQIRPWHLQAMMKIHPPLIDYTVAVLKRNADALQRIMHFTSSQLQQIVLKMPSLLGASVEGLQDRVNFWMHKVGLDIAQLQQAVLNRPALLQYSVANNLQPKLDFFNKTLGINVTSWVPMTINYSIIWGLSLERNLKPKIQAFYDRFPNLTVADVGRIINIAPELLAYNWKGSLEVKLDFLQKRLHLSDLELQFMIQRGPRILMRSVRMMEPNIQLMDAISNARKEIVDNPSILMIAPAKLQKRYQHFRSNETQLEEFDKAQMDRNLDVVSETAIASTTTKRQTTRSRPVLVIDQATATIEKEFPGAVEAAQYAGVSRSQMYRLVNEERVLNGRQYVYGNTTLRMSEIFAKLDAQLITTKANSPLLKDLRRLYSPSNGNVDPAVPQLSIRVAGRAFPPEDLIRGSRRAGVMALYLENISRNQTRTVYQHIWNKQRARLLSDGQTVILEYPLARPSRRRCSLHACREALRVATIWIETTPPTTAAAHVVIWCDSNYVLELVQNQTALLQWGEADSKRKFVYTGPIEAHMANPDILYPLARSYYHLVMQDQVKGARIKKNVTVSFHPAGLDQRHSRIAEYAQIAARLMYHNSR